MKRFFTLACISLVLILNACDDNDKDKKDDLSQSSSALSFSCQNDVQTVTFKDNTKLSMSCTNYGGCDSKSELCLNAPLFETPAKTCDEAAAACSNSIRYMCSNNSWYAIETCELGCFETTSECQPNVQPKQCNDGEKTCKDGKSYICKNNTWTNNNADNTECEPECNAGDSKCENGYYYQCENQKWKGELCDKGCNGNVCAVNSEPEVVTSYCDGLNAMIVQPDGKLKEEDCGEGFCYISYETKSPKCCSSFYCDSKNLYKRVDGSIEHVKCNPGDPIKPVCKDIYGDPDLIMTAYLQYECTYSEDDSAYYYTLKQAEGCKPYSCTSTDGCVDYQTTEPCEIDYSSYLDHCDKDEVGLTIKSKEGACDESWEGAQKVFYTSYICSCNGTCCRWTYSGDGCYDE